MSRTINLGIKDNPKPNLELSVFPPPGIKVDLHVLENPPEDIEESWKRIVEIPDNEGKIAKHSIGVAWFAYQIGRAYGLNSNDLEIIKIASLLHDYGQTDECLNHLINQQEVFTPSQRSFVDTHAPLGYESLLKVGFPSEITLPALAHHSSYDRRRQIYASNGALLATEIITLADGIEAMRSHARSWQKPMTMEEVFISVKENVDRRYSPELLPVLERVCADTVSLSERLQTTNTLDMAYAEQMDF